MKNGTIRMQESQYLRQKAEHLLNQANDGAQAQDPACMPPQEVAKLVHELSVHQIELKMQNDELRRIQAELEKSRDRYLHLYDFAPTAYLTVDEKSAVVEANLTAATLLERPRSALVGTMFSRFVHRDDQDVWYLHRKRLLEIGDFQAFQLRLVKNNDDVFYVNLECMLIEDHHRGLKAIRIAATDITELKRAEEALGQLNASLERQVTERTALAEARGKQLQSLAVELIVAEERERDRISTLLHEDLQQVLAAARFQVQAVYDSMPDLTELSEVERMLSISIAKTRRISHDLSPTILHHSSLAATLGWLSRQMRERFGLKVQVEEENIPDFENFLLKILIFRATQELLFNISKHAGVQQALVHLSGSDGRLSVTVTDQGKGFDPAILEPSEAKTGLGLLSLRERLSYIGGSLSIESAPGQGSRITLAIPTALTGEVPSSAPPLIQASKMRSAETL